MTPEKKRTAVRAAWYVVIPTTLALLGWGALKYDATNLSVNRFVVDSLSRDAKRESDRALLLRIDSTVRQMNTRDSAQFCSAIPAQFRPGCKG